MANTILTPVTLWKDFDESLPPCEEIISEKREDGFVQREVYFLGRQTEYGRVKIYSRFFAPEKAKEYPVVMIFFEAGQSADPELIKRFTSRGYGVLCVDYSGDMQTGKHTIYPRDIEYANLLKAGRAMEYVDKTAKETCWYEWAAVARYAVKYLNGKQEVTKVGALGLRTGGEVLWKIAPYSDISCLVTVCAAGWLAYRGLEKFAGGQKQTFDEERHRFIAGIDSQSYAPRVKCPVMLLSAINDKKNNYDRVYDTFQLVNPDVEKAILYSSHGNGLIGDHSFTNIELFFNKYLKGYSVFISKPVRAEVFEEEGTLQVKIIYDDAGDPSECGLFYTEKLSESKARDWTRIIGRNAFKGNVTTIPLDVYQNSDKVLLYAFVRYSNGFSVTSKIQDVALNNPYKNSKRKSCVLFSSKLEGDVFSLTRRSANAIADCFAEGSRTQAELAKGYGGIEGALCDVGLISYRVSEPRYEPHQGAAIAFDAYCPDNAKLFITFYCDEREEVGYTACVNVSGGGKWKKFVFDSSDFKTETGAALESFSEVVSIAFQGTGKVLVNNVIWL